MLCVLLALAAGAIFVFMGDVITNGDTTFFSHSAKIGGETQGSTRHVQ